MESLPKIKRDLGGSFVAIPPERNSVYDATPSNALVFCWFGVDGVHYAVLEVPERSLDECPVLQVSPMDFGEEVTVLANSFLEFLADGCAVSEAEMVELLEFAETDNGCRLSEMLSTEFDSGRLLMEARTVALCERWQDYLECRRDA